MIAATHQAIRYGSTAFFRAGAGRRRSLPAQSPQDTSADTGEPIDPFRGAARNAEHLPDHQGRPSDSLQGACTLDHDKFAATLGKSQLEDRPSDDQLVESRLPAESPRPTPQINPGGSDRQCQIGAAQEDTADVMAVIALPDPEVESLRLKASALEARIVDLSARQAEMEHLIREFEHCQYHALGDVLAECLRLRHEYLSLKASRSGTSDDRNAEREAADEYGAYQSAKEQDDRTDLPSLEDDEKGELKSLYRAAAMRCHPDRVSNEDKASAHDLFLQTQRAYRCNDLEGLRRILRQLSDEHSFDDQALTVTGKDRLQKVISDLQNQVADLILAVQTLQLSDRYRTASRTDNWNDDFALARQQWEAECEDLRQRIRSLAAA